MSHDDDPTLVHLHDGQLMRGPTNRPAWITVLRGRAWITQANDPDDHFLDPGQSMHLAPGAHVLISADGAAQLLLANAPQPRRSLRRYTMGWFFHRAATVP